MVKSSTRSVEPAGDAGALGALGSGAVGGEPAVGVCGDVVLGGATSTLSVDMTSPPFRTASVERAVGADALDAGAGS